MCACPHTSHALTHRMPSHTFTTSTCPYTSPPPLHTIYEVVKVCACADTSHALTHRMPSHTFTTSTCPHTSPPLLHTIYEVVKMCASHPLTHRIPSHIACPPTSHALTHTQAHILCVCVCMYVCVCIYTILHSNIVLTMKVHTCPCS